MNRHDWATHFGAVSSASASTMGHVSPQSAATDKAAYAVALRAAPMTEAQRQYTLTVARGEGHYGVGWKYPNAKTIADSQKFGLTGYEGADSNNWGATQGKGDVGSFPHVDYHANGEAYIGHYRKWSTPELGYLDVAKIILGGGKRGARGSAEIKAAIDRGDLAAAVEAQHANGYFELAPSKYLIAVRRNYADLTSVLGWRPLLTSSRKGWGTLAFLGAVGGIVAVSVGRRR